ncbi:hypothetical protein [Bariatricus sp. SGI.019]|uniref:hypothetical protein n=1 Tax=Bariatricus sp. SGI.019 TaxID=3420548 RepID=UPI003CFDD577
MNIQPYMEQIINSYYENDARKLHKIVDKVLKNLHFVDVDKEEYYSLATEIFVKEVIPNYNPEKSFDSFLYSTLYKKFCTAMTRATRSKRCTKIKVEEIDKNGKIIIKEIIIPDERLNAAIRGEENSTLEDVLACNHTVESEIFGEKEVGYSKKMTQYLKRLSILQREVLKLISVGFEPNEILEELHINKKQYEDCYNAIHAYRNISILM